MDGSLFERTCFSLLVSLLVSQENDNWDKFWTPSIHLFFWSWTLGAQAQRNSSYLIYIKHAYLNMPACLDLLIIHAIFRFCLQQVWFACFWVSLYINITGNWHWHMNPSFSRLSIDDNSANKPWVWTPLTWPNGDVVWNVVFRVVNNSLYYFSAKFPN